MLVVVSPGKLWMYPLSIALVSVEMAGENKAACMNSTILAGVAEGSSKVYAVSVKGGSGPGGAKLRFHSFAGPLRSPIRICFPASVIVTLVAVKRAWQPASQSWPIEINVPECKSGMMCTLRPATGKPGMSSSASCVDVIMVPLGHWMLTGKGAGHTFLTGACMLAKCEVLPVSGMQE